MLGQNTEDSSGAILLGALEAQSSWKKSWRG